MSLIDYAKRCLKPLLVMAAPGGRTAWLADELRDAGLKVRHFRALTGSIEENAVVISWLYMTPEKLQLAGWDPCDVVRLIRNPAHQIHDICQLARPGRSPGILNEAFRALLPRHPAADPSVDLWREWNPKQPLRGAIYMLAGYLMHSGGSERLGHVRTFRVEDQPGYEENVADLDLNAAWKAMHSVVRPDVAFDQIAMRELCELGVNFQYGLSRAPKQEPKGEVTSENRRESGIILTGPVAEAV